MCGFSIQSNSDTNYPELGQTPQVKTQSHKIPSSSPSDANFKSQIVTCFFHQLDINQVGFPNTLLSFDNLLEQFTELKKMGYLLLLVYFKGNNTGTVKDRFLEEGALLLNTTIYAVSSLLSCKIKIQDCNINSYLNLQPASLSYRFYTCHPPQLCVNSVK